MDIFLWLVYATVHNINYYFVIIKNKVHLFWLDLVVWYRYAIYYGFCAYVKVKRLFIKEKIRNYHEELKNDPAYIKYLEDHKKDWEEFGKALKELEKVDFDKMN